MFPMSEPVTTYYGLTLGKFPLLALVLTKKPAVDADIIAEFEKSDVFERNGNKGTPAHTAVAFGLLGVRIPLKK